MHRSTLTAWAVALSLVAPLALAQNVATVNGKAIPKSRVDAIKEQLERSGRPVPPEMQNQIKEEVITREIFLQEAQKQGLDTTADYKTQLELAQQTLLIRELFSTFQKNNPVTDADIKAEYDRFVAANSGKEFKARHILVEKEDEAKAIIAKIKKGAKFDDIAKKSSKDPGSAAKGGELDWAVPSNFVAEFAEALGKLSKGKMTETPVKTQFGYHIIRVEDIRDAQLPKLEDVKPQVKQQIEQRKLAKYQEELRQKAKVE